MPPIRIIRKIKPISINDGIYDFGENISGWVRIVATGEKGQEMSIKYDERLNEEGDLKNYIDVFVKREGLSLANNDIVTFSGAVNEEYAPSFQYHGFRYVKLTNAPDNIKVEAEVVHTDLKTISEFWCNDDMLNTIHEASVRSILTNYHGIPTDCPHREQNGWTGDAHLSCEQASINFDMLQAYQKWMYDIMDCQRKSGQLPAIIPTPNQWGFGSAGPAWDSALFLIPWQMYETYGDISVLASVYDSMKKYLSFLEKTTDDYTIDLGLGDWCPPKEQVKNCPQPVTSTAYFYRDAVIMAETSRLLGKETQRWIELSEKIKQAWRNTFLGDEELYKSQTFLACAIYQGLLTKEEELVFAARLAQLVIEKDYHTDCGILGQKYIFSALSDYGYLDVVYKMVVNPTMPSYAYWINQGMTTFCETWEMRNSCNHHMYSEVDTWFYKYLAGIRFKGGQITVNPAYLEAVSKVKASHKNLSIERIGRTVTVTTKDKITVIVNGRPQELENDSITFIV